MAQLKNTVVSGNLRVTDTVLTDTVQTESVKAHSSSSATTFTTGTNGQVLTTDGTNVYWGDVATSDVNVTQTATTTNSDYEVLFSGTADNTTRTEGARKNTNLKFNPSTGNLQATQLNGVAIGTSPKFTDTDTKVTAVGNHYTPSADANSAIAASTSGTEGSYAINTEYSVVTGVNIQRDAKGHVTGATVTKQKIKDTNTTYESKAAASGGTDLSLVTTGEKYTWNNKTSNTGTVTSVTINATSPIAIDSNSAITTSGSRTISHANSGVTAGTYKSVTVNATGHVTGGTNPTTLAGYGITDAKIASGTITLGSNTIAPIINNDVIQSTNPFTPFHKIYISKIDNAFYAANKRFTISGELIDGNVVTNVSADTLKPLFDGSYEGGYTVGNGKTLKIHMTFDDWPSSQFPSYPYGDIYMSFYYTGKPESVSARCYCNYEPQGIGWHNLTVTANSNSDGTNNFCYKIRNGYYAISEFEFTVVGLTTGNYTTSITELEMHLDRPESTRVPFLSKYTAEELYYPLTIKNASITASSFIKSGGTSSQFLKADGSVDSNTYSTTDTKVTQTKTGSSNTSWRPLLLGYSYSDSNPFNPATVTNTTYAAHLGAFAPTTGLLKLVGLKRINTSGSDVTGSNTDVWNTNGGVTSLSSYYQKPSGGIPASDLASGVIPSAPGTLNTTAITAQATSASEALTGSITLHKVAKTGTYSDLIGAPALDTFVTAEEQGSDFPIIGDPSNYYTKAETDAIAELAKVTEDPEGGFAPNVYYAIGSVAGSKTFTLNTSEEKQGVANIYYWTFTTSTPAPTITWPSQITKWYGSIPTIRALKHYEISVLDGIAVCIEI